MMSFGFSAGARGVKKAGSSFDITSLAWSGLWLPDYASPTWAATASAGASGMTGALVAGTSPANGTAQGGKTPADFNGTTHYLVNATDATTLYSTTDATIVALVWIDAADAATGNVYDDGAIIVDGNADFGLVVSSNGISVDITGFAYDGAYQSKSVTVTTGAYHLVMLRTNGTVLGMTVDSVAEVTQACGTKTVMTGSATVGQGYGGTHKLDGRLLMLGTAAVDLSASYSDIKTYLNTLTGLSL